MTDPLKPLLFTSGLLLCPNIRMVSIFYAILGFASLSINLIPLYNILFYGREYILCLSGISIQLPDPSAIFLQKIQFLLHCQQPTARFF
ncbi:hypothetical protein JTB14_014082 [Gonioctena quinquepunctata]|nr:hypothetical protein JTB14_014082 [Gonioctena quinquepunctata]